MKDIKYSQDIFYVDADGVVLEKKLEIDEIYEYGGYEQGFKADGVFYSERNQTYLKKIYEREKSF